MVFLRPELGTVEVRMIDMQSDYENSTLEAQVEANMHAVELVDAIGKASVEAYREGEVLISRRDNLERDYEVAIREGLGNEETRGRSLELLTTIAPYLSREAMIVFNDRVGSGRSPAVEQKELYEMSGRDALYEAVSVR